MSNIIEVELPNGLVISMRSHDQKGGMLGFGLPPMNETQEHLWKRFIHAITTTDWAALGKVYSTSMPMPRERSDRITTITTSPRPVNVPVTKEVPKENPTK